METLSIRQIAQRNLMTMLGFLILLAAVFSGALRAYLTEQNLHEQRLHVEHQASNIAHALSVYRDIVKEISRQPQLQDFIQFSMDEEAFEWARKTRSLLPGNIGLGLFDREGRLLGNHMRLRLGEKCVLDMHRFIQGDNLPGPRVHRGAKGMEHFDVVAPVRSIEGTIGVVFASFSLDTIGRILDRIIAPGQSLTLTAYDGTVIAQADLLRGEDDLLEYELPVPDTDWRLHTRLPQPVLGSLSLYLSATFTVLALLLVVVFTVLSRTMSRIFVTEMTALRELLRAASRNTVIPDRRPRLKETQDVFIGIRKLAEDIASYQKQLWLQGNTDDLTGLFNRRVLRERFPELLERLDENHQACLVLIDMDHFKPINDRYGHAVGDEVLQALADCLRCHCYPQDLCARLGGDEFVVILMNFDPARLKEWFQRLADDFQSSQRALGLPETSYCTLSAGAVVFTRGDNDIGTLLAHADEALYRAKQAGRAHLELYSPSA